MQPTRSSTSEAYCFLRRVLLLFHGAVEIRLPVLHFQQREATLAASMRDHKSASSAAILFLEGRGSWRHVCQDQRWASRCAETLVR